MASRVDLKALDVGHPQNCVIGQLYRYYDVGVRTLGIPDPFGKGAVHLGFMTRAKPKGARALTSAWADEVRKRVTT